MNNISARTLAVEVLERIEADGAYSNILLDQIIKKHKLSVKERSLLTELVYGVIQNKRLLDYYLKPYIKKPKQLDGWVRQVLRIAIYQMICLDAIPSYAAINEAVKTAKKRGHRGISGFVNGVLRNVQRHPLNSLEDQLSAIEMIGIQYSLPDPLVQQLIEDYGIETTQHIAKSVNQRSHVAVRVNPKRMSRNEAIRMLKDEGFEAIKSQLSSVGLIIKDGLPVQTTLFKKGIITVQDEASMLVAPALAIQPADKVLDACAAPGGKTAHIATFLDSTQGGYVVAGDIHEHKLKLIRETLERQELASVCQTRLMDAKTIDKVYDQGTFDKILVDAPCSGMGLLRRKPDIRFQKQLSDFGTLHTLQLAILTSAASTLKVGGRLVYSTCTIIKRENEHVINEFLMTHPQYTLASDVDSFDHFENGMVTILPHQYGSDGFFIAVLERRD